MSRQCPSARHLAALSLLGLSLFAGCSQSSAPGKGRADASRVGDAPPPTTPTANITEPAIVSLTDLRERIDANRQQIVVVDLWATWCTHCVQELPELAALQRDFPEQLHAIAVNVDFQSETETPLKDLQTQIPQVLKDKQIDCEAVICSTPFDEVLEQFKIYTLPAALIYVSGEIHQRYDGQVDYRGDVRRLVQQLLAP